MLADTLTPLDSVEIEGQPPQDKEVSLEKITRRKQLNWMFIVILSIIALIIAIIFGHEVESMLKQTKDERAEEKNESIPLSRENTSPPQENNEQRPY